MPLRDDIEPGGGEVRAGDEVGPVQAHIPGEQGEDAGQAGHLLPPRGLPRQAAEARPPSLHARGHQEQSPRHRVDRRRFPPVLGRKIGQHFPRNENGELLLLPNPSVFRSPFATSSILFGAKGGREKKKRVSFVFSTKTERFNLLKF